MAQNAQTSTLRSRPNVRPSVRVHSLDQALIAAAEANDRGLPLQIESAPGAGGAAGVGWWRELERIVRTRFPTLDLDCVLDCRDEAGTVLAAFRRGVTHVRFTGAELVRRKLRAIAGGYGAEIDSDPVGCLDLGACAEPACACREFLAICEDSSPVPATHQTEPNFPDPARSR